MFEASDSTYLDKRARVCFVSRVQCYERFNKPPSADGVPSYPLCAVRLKDAMDGAKDTPTCMRRSSLANNLSPRTYTVSLYAQNYGRCYCIVIALF